MDITLVFWVDSSMVRVFVFFLLMSLVQTEGKLWTAFDTRFPVSSFCTYFIVFFRSLS